LTVIVTIIGFRGLSQSFRAAAILSSMFVLRAWQKGRASLARTPDPVYNTALILLREVAMSVRLNITMDDDVYARLKKEVPPKKLSAFIAGAVRAKLHPDARALNAAYQAASKERWRTSFDDDWKYIDEEGWPK
jgi:Arc/MetJ family transcription regulator